MMKVERGPIKEKEGTLRQDYLPEISGQRFCMGTGNGWGCYKEQRMNDKPISFSHN